MNLLELCKSLGISPSEDYPFICQTGSGAIHKTDIKPRYSPLHRELVLDSTLSKYIRISGPHTVASDYESTVLTIEDFNSTTQTNKQSLDLLLHRLVDTRNKRDKYKELYEEANTEFQELESIIIKLLNEHGLDVHIDIPF